MGKPGTQTLGGTPQGGTANGFNNYLGGMIQGGGFNNLTNQMMSGQGYQNYNQFFNNQGGGANIGMHMSPYQAPQLNTQMQQPGYVQGQQFDFSRVNNPVQQQIGNFQPQRANLGNLGALANLFMGIGGGGGNMQGQPIPQQAPLAQPRGPAPNPLANYNPTAMPVNNHNGQVPIQSNANGTYTAQGHLGTSTTSGGLLAGSTPGSLGLTQMTPEMIANANAGRRQNGLPEITQDGYDPMTDPAVSEYYFPTPNAAAFQGVAQNALTNGITSGGGLGGLPAQLPTVDRVGFDPNFLSFLSQGLGSGNNSNINFNAPTVNAPNLNVNSQYAKDTRALLERQAGNSQRDLLERLNSGGGNLFGTAAGTLTGLLNAEALPAIQSATANANALEGQFAQTANLANQQAQLTSRDQLTNWLNTNRGLDINQLNLVSQSQQGNRAMDVQQRNVDASNQTQQQIAGLEMAGRMAGLDIQQNLGLGQLGLQQLGLMNDSQNAANQFYLQGLGMNNEMVNNQNMFNLNNAQMGNQFNLGLNNQFLQGANQNANWMFNNNQMNNSNILQNQAQQNNFQLGQGQIGANLWGTQAGMMNNVFDGLIGALMQNYGISTPQAQTVQTPSMLGQIMGGLGGLLNLAGSGMNLWNQFGGGFGGMGGGPNLTPQWTGGPPNLQYPQIRPQGLPPYPGTPPRP